MSDFTLHCHECGREVDVPEDVPDLDEDTNLDEYMAMLEDLEVECPRCRLMNEPSLTVEERQR